MIKVLFIGWSGYLGSHIRESKYIKNYKIDLFTGRVENISSFEPLMQNNYDQVWHFGSPNNDLKGSNKLEEIIIKGTRNVIAFTNQQKAKLIYASTMGIYKNSNNYERFKKDSTIEVINSCRHVCLLIPRVYSRDRCDGLIGALKNNKQIDDMSKQMTYLKINDFTSQFFNVLKLDNDSYFFKNLKYNTIQEIREWIS